MDEICNTGTLYPGKAHWILFISPRRQISRQKFVFKIVSMSKHYFLLFCIGPIYDMSLTITTKVLLINMFYFFLAPDT